MMNFDAIKNTTAEAQANLENALASLNQGIDGFQQIADDLAVNQLREGLTTINTLLDAIEEPLTVRKNVEIFKSQIDLLRPGISAQIHSVSKDSYIQEIREALRHLRKLLSEWQGTLKVIQTFPSSVQANLTQVEYSALPDYIELIAAMLKKVERLAEGII
jgi:uncharacterized phage infection (PIP) family protein YhgE